MQRLRRTSEFVEELSSSNKSQSRQTGVGVPTRPSSMDRAMERNPYLNMQQNSVQRRHRRSFSALGAQTPQKTLLGKSPGAHVIVTDEKHRGGVGVPALHNDKRWVQDQVVRITEYLRNELAKSAILGITPDFFNARSGGLRQMTIKQFVALVNYFLHFILGNRFNVGPNHVADIINILQKLRYPHQLNKSWLKTPNTQHSFGNVMLIFDFFMDFVQPRDLDPAEFELHFAVPEKHTPSQPEADFQSIPDVEFQAQLVRNTEEAFMLWDKGRNTDADAIQSQTCCALIQKCCNIASLAELMETNKQLEQQLAELEQQRPQLRKQDEEQCNKLSEELKNTLHKIEMSRDDFKTESKQLKQLQTRLSMANEEICSVESEIASINSLISKQLYSVEQRDALMEEVMQHKHMLKSQERAVRDMHDCSHHQQVILSRSKNQLREQVQKFNTHNNEIAYLQLYSITSKEDLQLPHNATHRDLQRIAPIIKSLHKKTEARLKQNSVTLQQLEQQILQLTHEIKASLNPKTTVLSSKLAAMRKNLQQHEELIVKELSLLETLESENEQRYQKSKTSLEECEATLVEKKQKLLHLTNKNAQIMLKAEQKYHECAKACTAYFDKYAASMRRANAELHLLSGIVESNQQLIDEQKQNTDT